MNTLVAIVMVSVYSFSWVKRIQYKLQSQICDAMDIYAICLPIKVPIVHMQLQATTVQVIVFLALDSYNISLRYVNKEF